MTEIYQISSHPSQLHACYHDVPSSEIVHPRSTLCLFVYQFSRCYCCCSMLAAEQMHSFPINDLPEKSLLHLLSYLPQRELCKTIALVCKKWRLLAYNGALWKCVTFRPEFSNFNVQVDALVALISVRFNVQLKAIDLPCDMMTIQVLHDLSTKCPNLKNMTLDFAKATQLYDFTDLQMFPNNLRTLCICLSDVIFLEGFMRRVYSCLSSLKVLHLIGTVESSSCEEEIFEVINLSKIRLHTPNLRLINLFGVMFVDDSHVELIAASCIHLETVALNFCLKITGTSIKYLTERCKKLSTLLLRHTNLADEGMLAVDWEKLKHFTELDISCTELSEVCLLDILTRMQPLTFLGVSHCDFFSDKVMLSMAANNCFANMKSFDASHTYSLTVPVIMSFIKTHGHQLTGLMLNGKPKLAEHFWITALPYLTSIRILVFGTAYGWFLGNLSRVSIDQVVHNLAVSCARLARVEIQWEPDTLRYSEKSSKFIDMLRIKCGDLRSVTLADGGYYEMVRSNFDRADRKRVVRATNRYETSIISQLQSYNDLQFN